MNLQGQDRRSKKNLPIFIPENTRDSCTGNKYLTNKAYCQPLAKIKTWTRNPSTVALFFIFRALLLSYAPQMNPFQQFSSCSLRKQQVWHCKRRTALFWCLGSVTRLVWIMPKPWDHWQCKKQLFCKKREHEWCCHCSTDKFWDWTPIESNQAHLFKIQENKKEENYATRR